MYCNTRLTAIASAIALLCSASASASGGTHVIYDDGLHHQINSDMSDTTFTLEKNSVLDVLPGGSAGSGEVSHAGVNVAGGTLIGGWTLAQGAALSMTGNARLNGSLTLFSGSQARLDGVMVTREKAIAFNMLGGALDLQHSAVQASDIAILTDPSHRGDGINVSGSQIVAGNHGIYLGGSDAHLTLSRTDITGGESALFFRNGGNTATIHGGTLISTGKEHIEGYGHPVKSGAIILHLSDSPRPNGQIFSVDSGTRIEDLASDGTGIYIMNGASAPVTASLTDALVTGGKYGIYITNPENTPGTTTLALNNTLITGRDDAAIRVEGGTHLNAALDNEARLVGGNGVLASVGKESQLNLSVTNSSLTGNLLNTEGGTANVALNKRGAYTGMMQNVTALQMADDARWSLTGNSAINDLTNGGTVALAHDNQPGTVLTVGNYTGNNGSLVFNTVLAGDDSPTDKLVVTGNTSGTTQVSVNNAGGTGAATLDGIELISVGGKSDGEFKQAGRIVAGAYDYSLVRGTGSQAKDWVLTNQASPLIPGSHIVRPEAGSYIANQAASAMFLTSLHDRAGENRYMNVLNTDGSVSSLWLRQVGNHNRFRDSSGQLRTTSNTYVAQLGGDLTQWSSNDRDRFHLGVMAGYGNSHNNTQSTVSGHSAKGSVDGYSVGMYGTWYQNTQDNTGAWVDGQLLYSWFDNHVSGESLSEEKYTSKGLTASVETGYTLAVGQSGTQDNPTAYFIEPQAQVTWMGVKPGDVTEANGTKVSPQGENNVQTRLGARAFLRGHNQMDNGKGRTFQPFVEVNWLHNTKRNGVVMNGVSLEQAGATNIGEVKLGVEGQLSKHTQLWGNVAQDIGGKGYSDTTAMLGVKYAF